MGQVIQLKQPLNTYIVEGYKQRQCVRYKVQANNIDQAWYKADLIAEDHLLDTWLVWRLDKPEGRKPRGSN